MRHSVALCPTICTVLLFDNTRGLCKRNEPNLLASLLCAAAAAMQHQHAPSTRPVVVVPCVLQVSDEFKKGEWNVAGAVASSAVMPMGKLCGSKEFKYTATYGPFKNCGKKKVSRVPLQRRGCWAVYCAPACCPFGQQQHRGQACHMHTSATKQY